MNRRGSLLSTPQTLGLHALLTTPLHKYCFSNPWASPTLTPYPMRHFVIEKIKAEDNLATLFNAYLDRLSYLEITVMPTGSMKDFRRLFTDAPAGLSKQEKKQAKHLLTFIPEFYRLQLLSNSLSELHRKVAGAIEVLTGFFAEYGGDLTRYAIENRLKRQRRGQRLVPTRRSRRKRAVESGI